METPAIVELRRRFKAALDAHMSAVTALSEATAAIRPATKELVDAEHKALVAMVEARDALLAAIATTARGRARNSWATSRTVNPSASR